MSVEVGGGNAAKSEPNVVPLCDILLVLLIIFMVVTPIISTGANVSLPEAVNTQEQPEPGKMTTIEIKADGTIVFNGAAVDEPSKLVGLIEAEMEKLKQETKTKVLLKADVQTPYGKIVDVMDVIKDASIEVVGLVTEKTAN